MAGSMWQGLLGSKRERKGEKERAEEIGRCKEKERGRRRRGEREGREVDPSRARSNDRPPSNIPHHFLRSHYLPTVLSALKS